MSPIICYFLPIDISGKYSLSSEHFCMYTVKGWSSFNNLVHLPLTLLVMGCRCLRRRGWILTQAHKYISGLILSEVSHICVRYIVHFQVQNSRIQLCVFNQGNLNNILAIFLCKQWPCNHRKKLLAAFKFCFETTIKDKYKKSISILYKCFIRLKYIKHSKEICGYNPGALKT